MTDPRVAGEDQGPRSSHFAFRRLDGGPELEKSFALRYQVFCEELGFLSPESYADGLERDAYDAQSLHFGAINGEGAMVGTVRLVRQGEAGLPILSHCRVAPWLVAALGGRQSFAEVSRLAVSARYRRRRDDGRYGLATPARRDPSTASAAHGGERRSDRPLIVFGLYKAMYQESKRQGITHWYAAMDQGLVRNLGRLHIHFDEIGPESDYYGPVTPYLIKLERLEQALAANNPALFREMIRGLDPHLLPRQARAA